EKRLSQRAVRRCVVKDEKILRIAYAKRYLVHGLFYAPWSPRWDWKRLHGTVPRVRCDDVSMVSSETHQRHGFFAPSFARQAANVDLTAGNHVGRAVVTDMGVVFPDYGFCIGAISVEQDFKRIHHVAIADIPGLFVSVNHGAIVVFGVSDDAGV